MNALCPKDLTLAIALAAFFLAPLAQAQDPTTAEPAAFPAAPAPPAEPADILDDESREEWQAYYRDVLTRARAAEARFEQANEEYTRARHRKRLQGERREELESALESARIEWEEASAALDGFPTEAQRAGVPSGWLRDVDDSY